MPGSSITTVWNVSSPNVNGNIQSWICEVLTTFNIAYKEHRCTRYGTENLNFQGTVIYKIRMYQDPIENVKLNHPGIELPTQRICKW